jgi:CBS domain-containing protein
MTEKIKRRGIQMPENYRPDVLELTTVDDIVRSLEDGSIIKTPGNNTISALIEQIDGRVRYQGQNMILVLKGQVPIGVIRREKLYQASDTHAVASSLIEVHMFTVYPDHSLDIALEIMLKSNQSLLPVLDRTSGHLVGVITEWDILKVFERRFIEDKHIQQHISLREKALSLIKKPSATE